MDVEVLPEDAGGPRAVPDGPVDTHCHLFLMEDEPATAVPGAWEAGVGRLICVGIDPESSRRSLELAESFKGVFATAGMHPHTASAFDREAGAVIEELLSGDVLPVLHASPAGTALGYNVHWTFGDFRRLNQ